MNQRSSPGRWTLARLIALALVIALAPLPVMAGPPGGQAGTATIRQSVAKIGATERLAATPVAAARAQSETDLSSKSFFKTPAGIITLALVGAGAGYALYSTKNDRIKSPAK